MNGRAYKLADAMRGIGWCICILISKESVHFWPIRTRGNICEYVRICHLTCEKLKRICLTYKEFSTRVTNSIVTITRVTNASTYLCLVTSSKESVTRVTIPFEFFIYLKIRYLWKIHTYIYQNFNLTIRKCHIWKNVTYSCEIFKCMW